MSRTSMRKKQVRRMKRGVAMAMAALMIVCNGVVENRNIIHVYASEEDLTEEEREYIEEHKAYLEDKSDEEIKELIESAKKTIEEKGYDYLTNDEAYAYYFGEDVLKDRRNAAKKGVIITKSGVTYKVYKNTKTSEVSKVGKSAAANVTIPNTIKVNRKRYKVVAVANKAFSNNKKVKKVTIGKNVTSIGKNAFKGCINLKSIVVKSSSLKKVGKNALQETNKKLVIKVPEKQVKAYKKYFNKKGNAKVKIKK